jgi:hypothetical protein
MNRAKFKFTGGPVDGELIDIPADAKMYHITRINKVGRVMIAVYHHDKQTDTFKFSYYINEGREWRDD